MNDGSPHPLSVEGSARIHTAPSSKRGYVNLSVHQGDRLVLGFDIAVSTLADIVRQAKHERTN